MYADVVIFDSTIGDTASYEMPHQYPDGIHWVIVNGKIAAHNKNIDTCAGKILYHGSKQ